MTTLIEFRHEVPDALQVLEATEQRLQKLVAMSQNIQRLGVEPSDEMGLVIGQLHRAVWVQRVALYGVAEQADPITAAKARHDLDSPAGAGWQVESERG